MSINLAREYTEAGVDYEDPALYGASLGLEGAHLAFPPVTCCSRVFADLEDEKIWTRHWIAAGPAAQIPSPGDLLPYTVGNHGLHVERLADGTLAARFNKAQHGGCRFIPRQCQTGRKTSCSYTSCGYSLDEPAIHPDELDDPNRKLGQYLGHNPDKLIPASVVELAGQLLVHVDPNLAAENRPAAGGVLASTLQELAVQGYSGASEQRWDANWKLVLSAWLRSGAALCATDCETLAALPGAAAGRLALYPNLCLEWSAQGGAAHVLQPVAMDATRVVTYRFAEAYRPAALNSLRTDCEAEQFRLARRYEATLSDPGAPRFDYRNCPGEPDPAVRMFLQWVARDLVRRYHRESQATVYIAPAFFARRN